MIYNILIGGSAGQGMDTISAIFEKILKKEGYYTFATKDYMSRVRGGHNFIQVRFGEKPINSHHTELDAIIALDLNTTNLHIDRLKKTGVLICDESIKYEDSRVLTIPMKKSAAEVGNPKVIGTVAIGALLKVFGFQEDKAQKVLQNKFSKKVLDDNILALKKGYDSAKKVFNTRVLEEKDTILINGNQAIALGALAAGVSFYSAYPMTPSTSVMTYLSKKSKEAGIIVEQAEDEIASIIMALGASYAGARAMTGTSGGGLSLMVEALGLAAQIEVPLVIVDSQRPSPATGLPTRSEQSDLSFILTASHGEAPRMILAVRSPEDAFYQTARALNIADKYQIPVIILTDQYLADTARTVNPFDFSKITIERHIASEKDLENDLKEGPYKRYKLTETGISKRILPGQIEGQIVLVDSDEHDEYGHITESSKVRIAMMKKRMGKLDLLKQEVLEPEYFGSETPETLLVGWGSTYGAIKDAVEQLNKEGFSTGALLFGDIYPLPEKLLAKYAADVKTVINVEQNYTGQLAKLIRQETGIKMDKSILKYDGRQISAYEIYSEFRKEVL
ncbi:2-oxoacid:acceptor oxidoreductase subunit alpha [Clostridium sp. DJ247]|uniref:2-oxoacid:acceptor oxidoreductase subunit alpha n=1 Tax=Clostridium sp. DJ247 TaxID=2726188 RepID=UPI00162634A8|nr:2-oxoacid:acceptor oxidoreductase subunit alpha [Clostridium sp. DJ247]MBC2581638.1 2-oxoacid:acceptor oxidoreductase subunit alpha [Clostridium sp. DJ247]